MKIKEITFENQLYAFVCSLNDVNKGLEFLSDDSDFIQLGTWNYEKNFSTVPHYHLEHDKPSNLTQEVVLVHKGSVKCRLFTNCLLYTSPSPRDVEESRMPSSA